MAARRDASGRFIKGSGKRPGRSSVSVDTSGLRGIARQLAPGNQPHVRVGVLQGAGAADEQFTMVALAATHEYGSDRAGVPERSFLRRTFREREGEVRQILAKLARQVVGGNLTMEKALEVLGQWAAAEVKKTITVGAGVPPPNEDSTVARKGSDRPLVDTGRLVQSITHQVVTGSPVT